MHYISLLKLKYFFALQIMPTPLAILEFMYDM